MKYSCVLLTLLVWNLKSGFSLSKDYIDLLDLADNNEFLWKRSRNNDNSQDASSLIESFDNPNGTGDNEFLKSHNLEKRQAASGQQSQLVQNKDYGECRTSLGEIGRCRHMIYCRVPELKNDVWRLVSQLCVIEKSTIGICCTESVQSRLGPQIITDINNNGLNDGRILNRPERRGCGITTKQYPRVSGGRPADPDEWPWMAALLRPGLPYVWCGGVLVTDRHVLTAAHCIYRIPKDQMFVRLGEYNTHALNETRARDFRIGAMVTHVDYNALTYENDIALIRVERPTLFNTYIWPVCMPPIGEEWSDRVGIVTGWGTQTFGGPHSNILMEVLIPIWKQAECKKAMVERIPDTVLCAGEPAGGQDSCQGDSGGPLLVQLPNMRWVTVGIVSWGVRCGEPNRPGMYTRVDKYLQWIVENSDI